MFRFASPFFLLFFLPLAGLVMLKIRQQHHLHIKMPSLYGLDTISRSLAVSISKALPLLKVAALGLLIIALARPQSGDQKERINTEGVNIILALDLSQSMRALDFKRNTKIVTRLEAVKGVVLDFIMKREGDRIGMVVFGTNAFTQVPLTRDYNTISFVLDHLEIGAAGPNTAIGDAIGISLKRLEDIKAKSNIIILLTDGKSNAGRISWQDAVKIAGGRNVKIYTIAVGSKGKAPFLVEDVFGKRYVYQNVDVDLEALKTIAKETNGGFFQAKDLASLEQIYGMINRLEKTEVEVEKWVAYQELYPWCIGAAMLCLCLYILMRNTRFIKVP